MDSTRPSVPAPPPAYSLISRATGNRSLRGIVLFCTACSFIWSLVVGVHYVRLIGQDGLTSRLKTVYLVQGIMFFILAALETVGFWTAWAQRISAGRLYVLATILGGVLMTVTEILRMALHFVWKTDIQAACAVENAGYDTADDIAEWCSDDWENGIWRDVAWLIFGVICSILMYILSKAYYHQLLDPNFGRQAGVASNRYRMNAVNTAPYGQDPPFVPPYGVNGQVNTVAGYGMDGEQQQQPPMYDAPAYAPPEKGFSGADNKGGMNKEQQEAMMSPSDERDLESHVQHASSYDSEANLPGRQGEGRV